MGVSKPGAINTGQGTGTACPVGVKHSGVINQRDQNNLVKKSDKISRGSSRLFLDIHLYIWYNHRLALKTGTLKCEWDVFAFGHPRRCEGARCAGACQAIYFLFSLDMYPGICLPLEPLAQIIVGVYYLLTIFSCKVVIHLKTKGQTCSSAFTHTT